MKPPDGTVQRYMRTIKRCDHWVDQVMASDGYGVGTLLRLAGLAVVLFSMERCIALANWVSERLVPEEPT